MRRDEPKIKSDQIDGFFEAVLELENMEECYSFFEDVCTVNELNSIAQRLEVAKLLKLDKTYKEIEKKTGASAATISRINRSLNYGVGGYKLILERLGYMDSEE